jgi:hypothetical protein
VHVLLDRSLGHPQRTGYGRVGATLGHQREHLALPRAERVQRIFDAAGRDELLDERRIDDRAAPEDPLDGLHEVVDVGDPRLQQIAGALAARQNIHRVLHLDMGGEQEYGRLRQLLTDHACCVEALGRVRRRHPDVHDRQVGLVLAGETEQLVGVAGLADDVVAGPAEQARESLAKEDVVVGDDDAGAGHVTVPIGAIMGQRRVLRQLPTLEASRGPGTRAARQRRWTLAVTTGGRRVAMLVP